MYASLSALVVGFTTTNTPPAIRAPNSDSTRVAEFSMTMTTRSPRDTPHRWRVAARRVLRAVSSRNVVTSPPLMSSACSGVRSSVCVSISWTRSMELPDGRFRHAPVSGLLAGHEAGEASDGVEVVGHEVLVVDLDAERGLEEAPRSPSRQWSR